MFKGMFSKNKDTSASANTTTKITQIQTVSASSTSRSVTREFRSVTSSTKTVNSNQIVSDGKIVSQKIRSSSDPFDDQFWKTEFKSAYGSVGNVQPKLLEIPRSETKIGKPSTQISNEIVRMKSGGYQSPYRANATTLLPTRTVQTTKLPLTSVARPNPFVSNAARPQVSSTTSSTTKKIPSKVSVNQLKSIYTTPTITTIAAPPISKVMKETSKNKGPKEGPGVVYIFNQERFDNEKEFRKGTSKDVKKLQETFGGCFKMQTKVLNDLKVKEIKAEVAKIERQDFSKKSCVVVVILTHGNRHDVVCAKDGVYNIDDEILFPMLRNKTLGNKPKIFIVQACKGDSVTEQYTNYSDATAATLNAPLEIAKLYSTFEGFVSYRGDDGSLFIQVLCENFQKNGKTKTVIQIMEDTIKQIVAQYKSRQVPTITHNMTEPLVFGSYI